MDQRAVIKNHKRLGLIAVSIHTANVTALEAEHLVIRRIDYDFNFMRLTTARRVDLFAREIHGQHEIGKADTPLLQSLQNDHAEAVLGQREDRLHELRHGIVQVQNDLCTEEFRHDRSENEDIRHVMHMDEVVPARE